MKTNFDKFTECLKEIGYSYRHCGCGNYQVINNLKKRTDIMFTNERLEIKNDTLFGNDRRISKYMDAGWVHFYFKNTKMNVKEKRFFSVCNKTNDIFITLVKIEK
jgi:hypothetical protein